jgi:hypothetical protein
MDIITLATHLQTSYDNLLAFSVHHAQTLLGAAALLLSVVLGWSALVGDNEKNFPKLEVEPPAVRRFSTFCESPGTQSL